MSNKDTFVTMEPLTCLAGTVVLCFTVLDRHHKLRQEECLKYKLTGWWEIF